MKVEDFCIVHRSPIGKRKILAYLDVNVDLLEKYFQECDYKPSVLCRRLGMPYPSLRLILVRSNLWRYVRVKNGKGAGHNRARIKLRANNGYEYTEDLNSYKIDGNRSRRKLKHIDVMEKHLGRELVRGEIVHHIDCDKLNNNLSNLHLCTKEEHGRLHKNLEGVGAFLVQKGIIKFDAALGYYLNEAIPNLSALRTSNGS